MRELFGFVVSFNSVISQPKGSDRVWTVKTPLTGRETHSGRFPLRRNYAHRFYVTVKADKDKRDTVQISTWKLISEFELHYESVMRYTSKN